MQKPPPLSSFTHMKYWPTWLGIFVLHVIAWLPFSPRMKAGEIIGMLTWLLGKERRYITAINIAICFPELDSRAQDNMVKETFRENGIGLVETATGWVRKSGSFKNQTTLIGLDKLEAAQAQGRGVLLIGGHYSTLDFGANLLSHFHPFGVTYRPHRNPLFDAFMHRGRVSNSNGAFDRNDIRGAFRHLKKGLTLWYAPDQDYGPAHAVYAPFFGHNAATITAGSRFAAINNSPVFLVRQHRVNKAEQYEIEFIPFPDSFPGEDDGADASMINRMLEQTIRQYPAQYLWMHKRFKTQPGGKPNSPYIDIKTPNHRLSATQYRHILDTAVQVAESSGVSDYKLPSGLWLREYPGTIHKQGFLPHPAKKFDRRAKDLRLQGIPAITVDNFFRIPPLKKSALTYFVPEGRMFGQYPRKELPLKRLAEFLCTLHDKGFSCAKPEPDMFIVTDNDVAVIDPGNIEYKRKPEELTARRESVIHLVKTLGLVGEDKDNFFSWYAQAAGISLKGVATL